MIIFSHILSEAVKGEWFEPKNLEQYKEQIFKLINTAYSNIGGNLTFRSPNDVNMADNKFYKVVDIDLDDKIDAVLVYKRKPAGEKAIAIGHDGNKLGKVASIKKSVADLKTEHYFIEASGNLHNLLMNNGIPYVDDQDIVEKILQKKINWLGDGEYEREIKGVMIKKRLFGKPKVR